MEILSNFSSAYCFISFILGAVFMLTMLCIAAMGKVQESMNKVHFYMARDKNGSLWLYIGKPCRGKNDFYSNPDRRVFCLTCNIEYYGLKREDYTNLKWEDEPVEVFLNIED